MHTPEAVHVTRLALGIKTVLLLRPGRIATYWKEPALVIPLGDSHCEPRISNFELYGMRSRLFLVLRVLDPVYWIASAVLMVLMVLLSLPRRCLNRLLRLLRVKRAATIAPTPSPPGTAPTPPPPDACPPPARQSSRMSTRMPPGKKRSISVSSSESCQARQKVAKSGPAPSEVVSPLACTMEPAPNSGRDSDSDGCVSIPEAASPTTGLDDPFEGEAVKVKEEAPIKRIPSEILCQIAEQLDPNDIISLRLTHNKAINLAIQYVFAVRFFSTKSVRTTDAAMSDLLEFLQYDNQVFARHVRVLHVMSDLTFWSGQWIDQAIDELSYDPLITSVDGQSINRYFRGYDGIPEWASGEPNMAMEEPDENIQPQEQSPSRLSGIFKQAHQLRHIVIHAPYNQHALLDTIDKVGSYNALTERQCWAGVRSAQYAIFRSFFRAIEEAELPISKLEVDGFLNHRGSNRHPDLYHHLAPNPQLLNMLDFSNNAFRFLNTLRLQYAVDQSRSRFEESIQKNYPTFLVRLGSIRYLEDFQFSCVTSSYQMAVENQVLRCKIAPMLLQSLRSGLFALKKLELRGFSCDSNATATLTSVFHHHKSTLRRLTLRDVQLWQPHTFGDFIRAVAKMGLEYFGWQSLIINNAWIVGSSIIFREIRTPTYLNFDPPELVEDVSDESEDDEVDYHESEDGESASEGEGGATEKEEVGDGEAKNSRGELVTAENVEGLHEWVHISWPKSPYDSFVEYTDGVQRTMKGAIEAIDCGAIDSSM
ncbi:hypothetical protein P154DRAFT_616075 [Amniculicola lignicola CBS 123094]|uniref:F-box domain-containing protein n=1 Tax=Amniculicola lignicola CBS 123094 TaxID=1392246 RepID=A0A6A5WUX5_9PLEO|nr:hypothetical protein P154DRAFT_616075 [Amniculicola lignicola CBS 123094]